MPNYSFYVALACACVDVLCLTVVCAHRRDFTGAREVTSAVDVANKHHTWTRFEAETHFIIIIFVYFILTFIFPHPHRSRRNSYSNFSGNTFYFAANISSQTTTVTSNTSLCHTGLKVAVSVSSSDDSGDSGELSAGEVAAIVIFTLLGAGAICFGVWFISNRMQGSGAGGGWRGEEAKVRRITHMCVATYKRTQCHHHTNIY